MPAAEIFHTTWGGEESLIAQLDALTPEFPRWARPLWRAVCTFLKPLIMKVHQQRTIRQMDEQAEKIGNRMEQAARYQQVSLAVAKAKVEHPTAKVMIRRTPHMATDCVYIEHPPTDDPMHQLMGFSSIEIRAPYKTD